MIEPEEEMIKKGKVLKSQRNFCSIDKINNEKKEEYVKITDVPIE